MRIRNIAYGGCVLLLQPLVACSDDSVPQNRMMNVADAVAPVPAPAPSADTKLVVAFGDSLFAGYNLELAEGFAPTLERALNKAGVKAQVVNAGVSGDTSAAGRARLAFTLDGLARKPDLVVLSLGGNDMLRGLSPEETRTNLDAILAELKTRGIPAVLTGMLAAPNLGPDYAAAFNPIYPRLAKAYGVQLYPFLLDGVLGQRALQLPDGIHPNPKGVDVMVAGVSPLVEKALWP
ncbi:arylesterase [Sphingobium aromaticiconvertens]|uniref:arylesterase n=1 Tax=Sphingobium aromaticiconvertens TaxID=365341 RepID=UPI003AFB6FC7